MHDIKFKKPYKNFHFIGIGGVHMSGMAEMLLDAGYRVEGSDERASEVTEVLCAKGALVKTGRHSPDNISADTDTVVYTAAVKSDNSELIAAQTRKLNVLTRADLLGEMLENFSYPVCIAGTHGKTTTTSMTAEVFLAAGVSPSVLVGGTVKSLGKTYAEGEGEHFIVESCEYCDSFLSFRPYIGVILNIDADHLDYFKDIRGIRMSFRKFAENIFDRGYLLISSAIENIEEITAGLKCGTVTFGKTNADYTAENIEYTEGGAARFDAVQNGVKLATIKLAAPGEHNVLNSLAAFASAHLCGIDPETAAKALEAFTGVKRRFEYKGEINGVSVYDDYAHHPTEIKAAVAAAAKVLTGAKWILFQPHTHSRTKSLLTEFAESFKEADKTVILDIYSPAGREEENTKIHALDLVKECEKRGYDVIYSPSFQDCIEYLRKNVMIGDAIITVGAGDIYRLGEMYLNEL